MSIKKTKICKAHVDNGFGFPVKLIDVPMAKVRNVWTPAIDYNELAEAVLAALAHKPSRLTGNEIRFIRLQAEMTLSQFGARFGVTHPCVSKWEEFGDRSTNMAWSTEKDIRLFVAQRAHHAKDFALLYRDLEHVPPSRKVVSEIDARRFAA